MSELIKKSVKILGLLIVALIIALMLKTPLKSFYTVLFPPKNAPTLAFGKLDPLTFVQADVPPSNPDYILNTTSGGLPKEIPSVVPVYKFVKPQVSYSAGEDAQRYAQILGFTDDMRTTSLSESTFKWKDVKYGGALEINLETKSIKLETPLGNKGRFFPANNLNKTTATTIAKSLLKRLGKYSQTLYENASPTNVKVEFGKFRFGQLIKADSILEVQIAKVDFFRTIDDYPVLPSNPKESLLQVYLKRSQEENRQLNFPILQAYEWEIDSDDPSATYPLTPIDQVWEQIQENKGVVANITPADSNPFAEPNVTSGVGKVLINEIYLAYYESKKYQNFAQPIYVFEGNYTAQNGQTGNITIYYPAISNEYID